ncbi:MAG: NUDIX hydrolase [Pseudomonadota bacterium]
METKKISEPKLSATVLLVRDSAELEVLMVRRHYQIDFASGALVFPGGKVSSDDQLQGWADYVDGEISGDQLIARIAAIREAFEESGLLIARYADNRGEGGPLVGPDVAAALAPHRAAVDRGDESFLELIKAHSLVLAPDTLVHFGHWITPTMMPKRFDTHFFFAPAPPTQLASHDGRETTDAVWLNPREALAKAEAEEVNIIFPTRMNLRKLSEAKDIAKGVERFSGEPVITVQPEVGRMEDGRPCLSIPEVPGYNQVVEPLENVKV